MEEDLRTGLTHRQSVAVEQALSSALEDRRVVGGVLVISEGGQKPVERAFGLMDEKAGRVMQSNARFRLASVTKPVATALFMTMVEDGTLDLQAPVTDFLPEFRPALPDGSRPTITLHHLLTHTSGLGYRFLESEASAYAAAGVSDGLDQPGLDMEENLRRLASVPLYFAPGQGWRYSLGIDVMGAVAEVATGRPLQQLLEDRICAPLGLRTLAFHLDPEGPELAKPYFNTSSGPQPLHDGMRIPLWDEAGVTFSPKRVHDEGSFPSCGAGLVGDAADLMTFFRAMLAGGGPILSPATVRTMMKNQLPDGVHTLHGPGWGFGYGWGVLTEPQGPSAHLPPGLLKWGGVYGHSWFMDPAAERICLLLTNTSYEGMGGKLPADLVTAFYPEDSDGPRSD